MPSGRSRASAQDTDDLDQVGLEPGECIRVRARLGPDDAERDALRVVRHVRDAARARVLGPVCACACGLGVVVEAENKTRLISRRAQQNSRSLNSPVAPREEIS